MQESLCLFCNIQNGKKMKKYLKVYRLYVKVKTLNRLIFVSIVKGVKKVVDIYIVHTTDNFRSAFL